jgi:UPF0755 protein
MTSSKSKVLKLASIGIIALLVGSGFFVTNLINSAPSNSPKELSLVVGPKSSYSTISSELIKSNAINNEFIFLRQAGSYAFPAIGNYSLSLPASSQNILEQLKTRSEEIKSKPQLKFEKLLIKEGATIDDIINSMAKLNLGSKSELTTYFKNINNFAQSKYPFLPTPLNCTYGDVYSCAKYLAEGYISPATYDIETNKPISTSIDTLLNISSKRLSLLGVKPTFEQIILASVIEKESGFGSRDRKSATVQSTLANERALIASAFNNRNKIEMKWQSNPTTTYGTDYKLCETTIPIPNCLKLDDNEIKNNKYNTYSNNKLFAPISNPSLESIKAAMNPGSSEYLFFIADKQGVTRFAKNYEDFLSTEKDIINER